ncbi:MAG: ShlB/FhaC/HecB family hemolysin secretion/activation protein [Gammaproteobacteria bacterium]
MKASVASIVFACLCLISIADAADLLPDAGTALRDVEQAAPAAPAQTGTGVQIDQQLKGSDRKTAGSINFTVKSFRISGNGRIATKELLPLIQAYCGDKRSLADIENAAARITEYYHSRGYLVARAYIPPQKITNGSIEIAVLEGRYGQTILKNKSATRDAVLKRFLAPARLGEAIDANRIDRALLLIQDTVQTGSVNGVLRAGGATGESDFEVSVSRSPRVTGRLEADNYGVRVTGRDRIGGSLQIHSPTGRGDRLEAKILTSGHGQDYGRLAYDLPLGGQGLRLGIGYTESRYRIGEEFSALDAYGRARVWSARATYPVVRASRFNLYSDVSYDHKSLDDHMGSIPSDTNKQSDVGAVGLSGDHADERGGITTFSLRLDTGNLRIETPAAIANDNATARTNGNYNKLSYGLARYQPVVGNTVLFMSLSGQQASKNLDSAEKLSLGGPFGVRAYPVGEAAGDDGYIVNMELRYGLPRPVMGAKLTLVGFVDAGSIRVNHTPFLVGSNERHLSGSGVGSTLAAPGHINVQFTYAWKLGDARAVSDADRSGRLWLQFEKNF